MTDGLGAYAGLSAAEAISLAAERVSNWGRWGTADIRGTVNHISPQHVVAACRLVARGEVFSLAVPFDDSGPQHPEPGSRGRRNPLHVMLKTGTDAAAGVQGRPHGFGFADDLVTMHLQCGTQWDGLGHIFDRGIAWNGRSATSVTSSGDSLTGIEHMADRLVTRAVVVDVARFIGEDALPPGFAITPEILDATITSQGPSSRVGTGDILLVRTGHLNEQRRRGWPDFVGGDAPGLSFSTLDWLHRSEVAAVASDTWGVEVRPNEFPDAFQPFHQVAIPHVGLTLGEVFDLDALAADSCEHRQYDCCLVGSPLPLTGAVGSPVNPVAVR